MIRRLPRSTPKASSAGSYVYKRQCNTDNPMLHGAYNGDIPDWMKEAFADATAMGRYGTPEDVAEAAVWLGRDECFMTGDALQINGGLTLRRNPLQADLDRHEREWKERKK